MAELLLENWIVLVLALVVGVLVAWWVFAGSRRTRVEFERRGDDAEPARRNQALIDAPAAARSASPLPPPTPEGLAGVGEAVAASAPPPNATTGADDLTRIKGVGPRLAQQLRELGVTSFAQIAAWTDADVDRIDSQLGRFQGRIRRDDWREQARFLAAEDRSGYEAKFGKL